MNPAKTRSPFTVTTRMELVDGANGTVAVATSAAIASAPANQGTLVQAIEALRTVMVDGDGPMLNRALHDHLIYIHFSRHSQTKSDLISDLAGKRFYSTSVRSQGSG